MLLLAERSEDTVLAALPVRTQWALLTQRHLKASAERCSAICWWKKNGWWQQYYRSKNPSTFEQAQKIVGWIIIKAFRKKRETHGAARRNTASVRSHRKSASDNSNATRGKHFKTIYFYFCMTKQIGLSRGTQILKANFFVTK